MLLLLPPSEGKTPPDGPPVVLDELAFARNLGSTRRKVLAASGMGRRLRAAPAGPAAAVYTGVLYGQLSLATLSASARARADQDLLTVSALWGLVGPGDRIPAYKLPAATSLPRLGGGIAATWRPAITRALASRDVETELVIDLRSGPYAAFWRPRSAQHLHVRAFRVNADGSRQVISHMAKASRGDVARVVLRAGKVIRSADDVAEVATSAGLRVELTGGEEPTLDVLEGPQQPHG